MGAGYRPHNVKATKAKGPALDGGAFSLTKGADAQRTQVISSKPSQRNLLQIPPLPMKTVG